MVNVATVKQEIHDAIEREIQSTKSRCAIHNILGKPILTKAKLDSISSNFYVKYHADIDTSDLFWEVVDEFEKTEKLGKAYAEGYYIKN